MSKEKYSFVFDKTDLRRMWLVLGAIDALQRPTIASISKDLGFGKSTVQSIVRRLYSNELPDFKLIEKEAVLKINNWGIINKKIVKDLYNKYLQVR